jgi:hypothetical protein
MGFALLSSLSSRNGANRHRLQVVAGSSPVIFNPLPRLAQPQNVAAGGHRLMSRAANLATAGQQQQQQQQSRVPYRQAGRTRSALMEPPRPDPTCKTCRFLGPRQPSSSTRFRQTANVPLTNGTVALIRTIGLPHPVVWIRGSRQEGDCEPTHVRLDRSRRGGGQPSQRVSGRYNVLLAYVGPVQHCSKKATCVWKTGRWSAHG